MFLNLKNGRLSVNIYRFVGAGVSTVSDILDSVNTKQTLTATLHADEDWQAIKFLTNKVGRV